MEHRPVDTGSITDIEHLSRYCGEVSVDCSDVAGIVQNVIDSFASLNDKYDNLHGTVEALDSDQQLVSDACDEAALLSERAISRLTDSRGQISGSLEQIATLLKIIRMLTQHVTGFAAAMEQVKHTSEEIGAIAEKTNILSLNAAIEAAHAGEAGRTFTVVANEVKELSSEVQRASVDITTTVDKLSQEGDEVIGQINNGVEASNNAEASVEAIEASIHDVCTLIDEVAEQNTQIVQSSSTIGKHVHQVKAVLADFNQATDEGGVHLEQAHGKIQSLEANASKMFDSLVKSGFSPTDSAFVETAREMVERAEACANQAIADGEIEARAFFDRDYKPIPGTNPECFTTAASAWAERNWQPMLDSLANSDSRIGSTVFMDENGHLLSHMTRFSQAPTGNVDHDMQFCRRGRVFSTDINLRAGRSTDSYLMSVYRREDAEGVVWRSVFLPVHIDGTRWGNLQISYQI